MTERIQNSYNQTTFHFLKSMLTSHIDAHITRSKSSVRKVVNVTCLDFKRIILPRKTAFQRFHNHFSIKYIENLHWTNFVCKPNGFCIQAYRVGSIVAKTTSCVKYLLRLNETLVNSHLNLFYYWALKMSQITNFLHDIGWFLVVLRIFIALAMFQPYRDLEARDNKSLKS